MIIESDGNGGWFLGGVDVLNASVHLTVDWCQDINRHQIKPSGVNNPGFNRLRYMLNHNKGTPDEIMDAFRDMRQASHSNREQHQDTHLLHDWIKGQRASNR